MGGEISIAECLTDACSLSWEKCLDLLRMDRNSFITLCNILKEKNLVEDGREISIEEQVAIFLLTVGHNERNRACQNTFQHSGQTISKYVNLILRALCQLGREYISRPNDDIPSKIRFNPRFYPYFKDCLGAIDGTHIPVWVRTSEQARFRNRKGTLSQNVLAVVGFDMRFHYVFAGWEGSATDSRVLYSALDTEINPFVIPTGKYYLGDGGYPNIRGLLTPYRGHRCHLSEFNAPGARRVTSKEELFNHRHSSLRTTVERVFGLLKGRFPILKAQVSYPYRTQVGIVLATCVLHNFIIDHNPNVEQFDPDEGASDNANESTLLVNELESATESVHRGSNNDLRSSITSQMFMVLTVP
ncbi:putative nuclease [Nymphaea thermarum]|nr:putative nuclease [Nymphaea thermarum]